MILTALLSRLGIVEKPPLTRQTERTNDATKTLRPGRGMRMLVLRYTLSSTVKISLFPKSLQ